MSKVMSICEDARKLAVSGSRQSVRARRTSAAELPASFFPRASRSEPMRAAHAAPPALPAPSSYFRQGCRCAVADVGRLVRCRFCDNKQQSQDSQQSTPTRPPRRARREEATTPLTGGPNQSSCVGRRGPAHAWWQRLCFPVLCPRRFPEEPDVVCCCCLLRRCRCWCWPRAPQHERRRSQQRKEDIRLLHAMRRSSCWGAGARFN